MTICARCHRPLFRAPVHVAGMALGPRCAALVAGAKPRRARRQTEAARADTRQQDLFGEVRP